MRRVAHLWIVVGLFTGFGCVERPDETPHAIDATDAAVLRDAGHNTQIMDGGADAARAALDATEMEALADMSAVPDAGQDAGVTEDTGADVAPQDADPFPDNPCCKWTGTRVLGPIFAKATYLRPKNNDQDALDAQPLALVDLEICSGDRIAFGTQGQWLDSDDINQTMPKTDAVAVFSASDVLLSKNVDHRVQDAVATSRPAIETWNDIPEDFFLDSAPVEVDVPADVSHLFVSVFDTYFSDNATNGFEIHVACVAR